MHEWETERGVAIKRHMPDTLTIAGRYTIPLRARYYQTEERVRGGPANGAMVVTLRYE